MLTPALVFIGCLMVTVTVVVVPVVGVEWPVRPSYNEVYPSDPPMIEPPSDFSASRVRNMSQTTDLREFIMQYVQDARICSDPALRNLILAEDGGDERAKVWWSLRCLRQRGGGVARLPTQSESSRKDTKKWKKIDKLMKDKRIKCKPKKMAVPLPNPNHTQLKPECVYIKQCGGCCNSPQLECVPIRTKKKTFPAMELTGSQFAGNQIIRMVQVEEHRDCRCECKVRPEHCKPSQVYNEDACQCQCPSHLSRSCPPRKVWNEKECRCECSRPQNCTTGRYFDVNSCRC